MRALVLALLSVCFCAGGAERYSLVKPAHYTGMCDASGGIAVNSNLFVVVDDEDNILRVYRSDQPGMPIQQFDFNEFLELGGKSSETDLEAAARVENRAYWIGSHGRNRVGKNRPNRCRFFATDVFETNGVVDLKPVGRPYKSLLDDLIGDARFTQFHFADAARLAPKEADALNIEGLSATSEGSLLIGFRNPIPEGKALLIPFLNPNEVIEGQKARFGDAILLELAGLGIRDLAYFGGTYLILAGSFHGGGPFQLYRWAGPGSTPTRIKVDHLNDYTPEGIIIYPGKGLHEIQIVSDDGSRLFNGVPGKELTDPQRKTFRSFWLKD